MRPERGKGENSSTSIFSTARKEAKGGGGGGGQQGRKFAQKGKLRVQLENTKFESENALYPGRLAMWDAVGEKSMDATLSV